jgi:hypothetical protein
LVDEITSMPVSSRVIAMAIKKLKYEGLQVFSGHYQYSHHNQFLIEFSNILLLNMFHIIESNMLFGAQGLWGVVEVACGLVLDRWILDFDKPELKYLLMYTNVQVKFSSVYIFCSCRRLHAIAPWAGK